MKRREFMLGLSGLVACSTIAQAQQKERRVRRIAILMPFPNNDHFSVIVRVFRQELLKLGWSESNNVQFDERWSTDNMDMVRADAASIVEQKPDVIFIIGDRVTNVFMKLTEFDPNRCRGSYRCDCGGRGGKLGSARAQPDRIFAHGIFDVRKDAGDFEADCAGHLPCRHDV